MKHEVFERDSKLSTDEIAAALVKLYAFYWNNDGGDDEDNYAKAVGIAIRMLTD